MQVVKEQPANSLQWFNIRVLNYYEKNGYISIQILHIKDGRITMRDKDIFVLVDDTINTLTYFITYY